MSSVDEHSAKRIGSTLRDKWVLEELLGVGGMASVYAARHKIGRRDAIKILHPKVAASEQLRARFEQEAHAVNAFKHPGVVEIRDVDTTEDGAPFLVMELLEGESLAQRIDRQGSFEPREILEIGAQVLDALAAAHARGIIHRDIKPDNIFLSRAEGEPSAAPKVKVLDFGIAQVRSADKRALTTKAGITLGTMAYMAPEQARGEEIDGRADVYAVGATVFRAMAGRFVHDSDSQAALVMRVIAHGAPRLLTVMPTVPPDIAAVVDRSLAFERTERYPDAATMLSDVRAVLAGDAPPYASSAPPITERPDVESLFDATPSEHKGKPTVVGRARQVAPAETTRVGNAAVPASALPPYPAPSTAAAPPARGDSSAPRPASAPTRVSPASPRTASPTSSVPASERVVIVPSQRGVPPTANMFHEDAGQIATVHGLAPPPGLVRVQPQMASRPAAAPVLTPFGELSAFVKSGPPVALLVVGGAVAVLATLVVIVAVVLLSKSPSSDEAGEIPHDPATVTTTTPSAPPPPRTPVPTTRPQRR